MSESYYQILGIPSDSDERQIKQAYHKLARELHPDKAKTETQAREAEQKFAEISKAYNALKDPKSRKEHDAKLASSTNGAGGGRPMTPTAAVMNASRNKSTPGGANKNGKDAPAEAGVTPQREAIAQKAYFRGVHLTREKNYAKAVEFFDAAIANNPHEASYYAQLGLALINARKSASRAIEVAQKAIELQQYSLDYKFNLAQIYETIGSKSNAIKVYEEILKWDENNQAAQQMLRALTKKNNIFSKITDSSLFSGLRERLTK